VSDGILSRRLGSPLRRSPDPGVPRLPWAPGRPPPRRSSRRPGPGIVPKLARPGRPASRPPERLWERSGSFATPGLSPLVATESQLL